MCARLDRSGDACSGGTKPDGRGAARAILGRVGRLMDPIPAPAAGDLRQVIRSQGRDEIGALLRQMETVCTSLVDAIGEVRQTTVSVHDAANQIAAGSKNLQLRTDGQIDVLRCTFSAMEDLKARVRENVECANQATQLGLHAGALAAKGGKDVERFVRAMDNIDRSSRTIAGILSVIDGIAFQTNIFAPKAPLEAARAGNQGRGFAMVASAVRSLAQRCANAAREFKALSSGSVRQVE
jgi:methyl-accepting chemotaxis protein